MFNLQGEWEEKYFQATDMNIKEVFHKYVLNTFYLREGQKF